MKKITTLLSTSAFALVLGMNTSYASDITAGDEDAATAVTPAPVAMQPKYDPADLNHDGHVTLIEKIKYWADANHDGKFDGEDFKLHLGKLWSRAKGIFWSLDTNNDGYVEFSEIIEGTHKALQTAEATIERFEELSGKLRPMLAFLPGEMQGTFTTVLDSVDTITSKAKEGVDIAEDLQGEVGTALKTMKGQLDGLLDGDITPDDMSSFLKTTFAYVEMLKSTKDLTGDNKKIVKSIEKKLAEVNKKFNA